MEKMQKTIRTLFRDLLIVSVATLRRWRLSFLHLLPKVSASLFVVTFVTIVSLILAIINIPGVYPHPDEHQFYFNAFRIMGGKELHNYVHVALTEYLLAGFLTVVNLFTDSGVNFPQGDPSAVTFYYGRWFGLFLYLITFIFGVIVLQKGEKTIRPRSAIFSVLYFSSLGLFERFLRVNSDSILTVVFLNYLILSFYFHQKRRSTLWFFALNLIFVFLSSFTNFKSLFLIAPILIINTLLPIFFYSNSDDGNTHRLPTLYTFVGYLFGLIGGVIFLWTKFIPYQFNVKYFWYATKKTIIHGTKFDFDFPSQSVGSWKVYIYDFIVEYLGVMVFIFIVIALIFLFKIEGKKLFSKLIVIIKRQIRFIDIKSGDIYKSTEIILFASGILYYLGISLRTIHWSRWGMPFALVFILGISSLLERLLGYFLQSTAVKKIKIPFVVFCVLCVFSFRILLFVDLLTPYLSVPTFPMTHKSVSKFLEEKNINGTNAESSVAWFIGGYSSNVTTVQMDKLSQDSGIKYLLWPVWQISDLYGSANVDRSRHNFKAFLKKYSESTSFRFPTFTSYYTHAFKYLAYNVFHLSWSPELESLMEEQYGVVSLKQPRGGVRYSYEVSFSDLFHYYFPYSLLYNMKELPEGYMFPPCYTYVDTRTAFDGEKVAPPPEIGVGARTAGLYCHSIKFWNLFKGNYKIRVEGLPEDPDNEQKVFSNYSIYNWIPETKTFDIKVTDPLFVGDFGVATKERYIPNLKFIVYYSSD